MNCHTSTWRRNVPSTFFVCFVFQLLLVVFVSSTSSSCIPFQLLAKVVQEKLSESSNEGNAMTSEDREELPSISKLTRTLSTLASNQQTFKGLDGAAHEVYQRTHSGDDVTDTTVSGRAKRSAARLAAVAEALYACELIEVVENSVHSQDDEIFQQKEVILNVTLEGKTNQNNGNDNIHEDVLSLSVLVIYEPFYSGGVGLNHGSVLSLAAPTKSSAANVNPTKSKNGGQLIVVLGDHCSSSSSSGTDNTVNLTQRVQQLSTKPQLIKLSSGLVTNELVSVQPTLYKTAGKIITLLEPQLRQYNTTAVHFVGHSLAGGVASLAACILDGVIPMPKKKSKGKIRKKRNKIAITNAEKKTPEITDISASNPQKNDTSNESNNSKDHPLTGKENQDGKEDDVLSSLEPLNGLGRARCSALSLGAPPCLSSNVIAGFCTSFIYGDDIVCRTTEDSINRLVKRIEKNLHGGFFGKKLGWMSDTLSLTASSLKSHAHGSEGEETRLSIPGRAYLVRPRRLGGLCSIHEVGNLKKGGAELLRERLLWQMHDVLLSSSMWKHHNLGSYIHGLDRTQLRGVVDIC